jgi:hypothetical protein
LEAQARGILEIRIREVWFKRVRPREQASRLGREAQRLEARRQTLRGKAALASPEDLRRQLAKLELLILTDNFR